MTLQVAVHRLSCGNCNLALELAEILRAEQELSIQVALLDRVQISDMDSSIRPSSETNQRPILEHLTPNSTSTDEELLVVCDLVLEVTTENSDLGVVSCPQGLDVRLSWEGVRERLERVEVHVLHHWVELCTDGFEYFLRDKPANDGIGGCEVSDCLER